MFEAWGGAPTFCSSAKVVTTIRPKTAELNIPIEIPARRRHGILRFMFFSPIFIPHHKRPILLPLMLEARQERAPSPKPHSHRFYIRGPPASVISRWLIGCGAGSSVPLAHQCCRGRRRMLRRKAFCPPSIDVQLREWARKVSSEIVKREGAALALSACDRDEPATEADSNLFGIAIAQAA
jgi:hypothetical protein